MLVGVRSYHRAAGASVDMQELRTPFNVDGPVAEWLLHEMLPDGIDVSEWSAVTHDLRPLEIALATVNGGRGIRCASPD
jgi:hypothetical protein